MDIQRVDPAYRKAFASLPKLTFGKFGRLTLMRLLLRLSRSKPVGNVSISSQRDGRVSVRIFKPLRQDIRGALMLIHGGGLVSGTPQMLDSFASMISDANGLAVLCPRYRLAPETPGPAALEDCWAAWHWCQSQAGAIGIGQHQLAIGGVSAGGGLAAALAQRLTDEGGPQPFAQALIYPMLDDQTAADHSLDAEEHLIWPNANNRFGWNAYLNPHSAGVETLPEYLSPARRDDLAGLPPAWIGCGDLDLFHTENSTYAERLRTAGVPCEFISVKAVPHGFDMLKPSADPSRRFHASMLDFLRHHLPA